MAWFNLDFGEKFETLTQAELRAELETDRAIREALTGVKNVEQFYPLSVIAPGSTTGPSTYTTPAGMVPAGYKWAVMSIGAELAAAQGVRVYKGVPPTGAPQGGGRFVGQMGSAVTPGITFSKGQFTMAGGDVMTFNVLSSGNLLSLFIAAIEIPAERFGELLV